MSHTVYKKASPEAKKLRKEAGVYVKRLRERAELSQLELSEKLGLQYYTFISQVEQGVTRVPPESLREWAKALNVEPDVFARNLLRFYDPFTFDALFSSKR